VYWAGWIKMHDRRKRDLVGTGGRSQSAIYRGLVLLGFTAVYREGFEVVLFLQSIRLRGGSHVVLEGVTIGLGLALMVDRFLLEHPAVKITLHFADDVVELVGNDIDVALRFGPLNDSSLMARLLLRGSRVVCASPAYWNERGVPRKPDDLTEHNCLVHARPDAASAAWPFLVEGKPISVRVQGDRVANDSGALRDWALAGRDVIRRGALGIRKELSTGQLVTALDVFSVGDANLYAVTTGQLRNQRVIAFIDFLEQQLLAAYPAVR